MHESRGGVVCHAFRHGEPFHVEKGGNHHQSLLLATHFTSHGKTNILRNKLMNFRLKNNFNDTLSSLSSLA